MRNRTVIIAGAILASATLLVGCSSGSSPAAESSAAAPSAVSSTPTPPSASSKSLAPGEAETCAEIGKLLGTDFGQQLLAAKDSRDPQQLIATAKEVAPILLDFVSDLPAGAPETIKNDVVTIGGRLTEGVLTGSLSDEALNDVIASATEIQKYVEDTCQLSVTNNTTE